jgi:hypothetical protein
MLDADEGWYTNSFLEQAGCENFNYKDMYQDLGEVRFLAHLHHAQRALH